jgi:hypothetical protein
MDFVDWICIDGILFSPAPVGWPIIQDETLTRCVSFRLAPPPASFVGRIVHEGNDVRRELRGAGLLC